jgi:hypothetical protein
LLIFGHNSYDPVGLAKVLDSSGTSSSSTSTSTSSSPPVSLLMPVHYMVFVREPLSRIVSFSNFNEEPLNSWLNPPPFFGWQRYAINAMTGMINGVIGIGPGIGPNYLFPDDPRSCANNPAKNSRAVAYAKHQLLNVFSFVGDTANFEESVWLMYQTYGKEK